MMSPFFAFLGVWIVLEFIVIALSTGNSLLTPAVQHLPTVDPGSLLMDLYSIAWQFSHLFDHVRYVSLLTCQKFIANKLWDIISCFQAISSFQAKSPNTLHTLPCCILSAVVYQGIWKITCASNKKPVTTRHCTTNKQTTTKITSLAVPDLYLRCEPASCVKNLHDVWCWYPGILSRAHGCSMCARARLCACGYSNM